MAIIVNGKRVAGLGKPGKSAYQAAVDGGYTKTETEFNDALSKIDDLFTSVSDGKATVAAAITDKGVETAADATFQQMADNIGAIQTGTDTSDATATASDILSGKTAFGAAGKITGTIGSVAGTTITPGTATKTAVAANKYTTGAVRVAGDANLVPENIKSGVSIFGVAGTLKSGKFNLINATVETENTIDVNDTLYPFVILSGNPPAGSEDVSDVGFATVYAAKYNFGSVSVRSETMMVAAGGEVQLSFSGTSKIQYSNTAITGGNFPLGWEYQIITFDAEL